jgi:superfamily II DNA or RNA helicase
VTDSPPDRDVSGDLNHLLSELLAKSRGMPISHLHARLSQRGWVITPGKLSQHLRSNSDIFQSHGVRNVEWRLKPDVAEIAYKGRAFLDKTPPLRDWQSEALKEWRAANRQGIVQAITGAGKTLTAVTAIRDAAHASVQSLVIVPTTPLVEQWERTLVANLPGIRVARQGGGARQRWHAGSADVVVSTVQTAANHPPGADRVGRMLLVADEAHHYAARTFRPLVRAPFGQRLGLTATLQRQDDADLSFLIPTIGPIVFKLDYAEALAAEVVAPFDVTLVGVDMNPQERADYQELSSEIERLEHRLRETVFSNAVELDLHGQIVSLAGRGGHGSDDARSYVRVLQELRDLVDTSPAKMDALARLRSDISASHGALLFTQSVELARAAAKRLNALQVRTATLTAENSHSERQNALARFAAGSVEALIAPQLLDEGIDVPDANLGIVLSASRTRRQMVQRMGRVIRPKSDGGSARFVVVYGKGTREDPSHGAHHAFLEEVLPLARSVTHHT